MMLNRNAYRWIEGHRNRKWDAFFHGELNGKTVGIIGAGYSGVDLALKAKAFHMTVLGLRRNNQPTPNFDEMFTPDRLHEFLGRSDFVVVTAPKTPETTDMLGEAEFRAMKKTAFYVRFSRGGVANDEALYKAITEGWIAGAGLDAHGSSRCRPTVRSGPRPTPSSPRITARPRSRPRRAATASSPTISPATSRASRSSTSSTSTWVTKKWSTSSISRPSTRANASPSRPTA